MPQIHTDAVTRFVHRLSFPLLEKEIASIREIGRKQTGVAEQNFEWSVDGGVGHVECRDFYYQVVVSSSDVKPKLAYWERCIQPKGPSLLEAFDEIFPIMADEFVVPVSVGLDRELLKKYFDHFRNRWGGKVFEKNCGALNYESENGGLIALRNSEISFRFPGLWGADLIRRIVP